MGDFDFLFPRKLKLDLTGLAFGDEIKPNKLLSNVKYNSQIHIPEDGTLHTDLYGQRHVFINDALRANQRFRAEHSENYIPLIKLNHYSKTSYLNERKPPLRELKPSLKEYKPSPNEHI